MRTFQIHSKIFFNQSINESTRSDILQGQALYRGVRRKKEKKKKRKKERKKKKRKKEKKEKKKKRKKNYDKKKKTDIQKDIQRHT